ncbi:TetR/AcrR family transcriptional regulator [Kribbella sp.]|uniref:TetR/AcrR family transcriptional regulator n=1 Tax=Kribbella sp. TaxID=1871183 RepID=UPI002D4BD12B|nr:TetR/AcrR family transcriptional regulator [Kribbella sp.]HZX01482.1 TetR/AcrR family transcriptional regulator [Kribbella sp.]
MTSSSPAPTGRQGRKASARGESRREELIAAAATLFAERGYATTSIADVAAAVGVTQQALLYYFGNKVGLLHAVIDQRDGASLEFAEELTALGGPAAIEQLPRYARRNVANPSLASLFAVLVMENLRPGDVAHEHFVTRYRNLRAVIEQMITAGQESGEFSRTVDARLKAFEILAFIEGANTQWLLDPDSVDLVAATTAYATDLLRTLTP